MTPTVGSLFAGIGGFDLGFERAGFKTAWQVEIDPYCRKVLERDFPDAKRYNDVRDVGAANLEPVDVICGGFPCQDISNAGKRAGIDGERSGLWSEYARIIGELRPRFVLVENVAALLGRGIGRVLGDLAALGYDAEWEIISAADVGAPHLRERVWILAYAEECGRGARGSRRSDSGGAGQSEQPLQDVADAILPRLEGLAGDGENGSRRSQSDGPTGAEGICGGVPVAYVFPSIRAAIARGECGNWLPEPDVGRVAHGIPARVDRLKALGNAVVPQIPEMIARRIKALMEGEASQRT